MYAYSIRMPAKFVELVKGTGGKKYKAIFYDAMRKKIKSVQFGAVGYQDYTQHGDLQRKQNYIQRHKTTENWQDPMTAGACARWILWDRTTVSASFKAYRQRFNLELF
jgi:hypothetical protein